MIGWVLFYHILLAFPPHTSYIISKIRKKDFEKKKKKTINPYILLYYWNMAINFTTHALKQSSPVSSFSDWTGYELKILLLRHDLKD